jgi:hypothetical protein
MAMLIALTFFIIFKLFRIMDAEQRTVRVLKRRKKNQSVSQSRAARARIGFWF